MSILGRGIYSLSEAARLTRLRPARVRAWFRESGDVAGNPGVFRSDYPSVGDDRAISFLDLIEVCIAGKLRAASPPVSLQHIRKVHRKLSSRTGQRHPFCAREIFHGGGRIFTRRMDDPEDQSVIEPLTDQAYIDAIILPFLERIDYDQASRLAMRWRIAEMVVVDPAICFGKPIVEEVGIATSVLASAYLANGLDARVVASWYDVRPAHVEAAAAFENGLAA